jgi:hypothetical protein
MSFPTLIQHARVPGRARIAGVVVLATAVAFLVLERLAEANAPGFDATTQPLSGLGNWGSPVRDLWVVGLLGLAASWVVGVALVLRPRGSRPLIALNLVPVVGIVISVAVPLNANLAVHEVAAFSAFVGGNLAMLANALHLRQPWRLLSFALAGIAVVAMSPAAGLLVGLVGWGTLERLVVVPLVGSLLAFGVALTVNGERAMGAQRPGRRAAVVLAAAGVLAVTGIGTGITAGGDTVVGAEVSRAVTTLWISR